jgi:hypothetical protein
MLEWTGADSYAARVSHVQNGTGLTGGYRLVGGDGATQTVFEDNSTDTITGNQGLDWFFANQVPDNGGPLDVVTDQAGNEMWSDTDF